MKSASPSERHVALSRTAVEHALRHPLLRALVPTELGIGPSAKDERSESKKGIPQAILIYCARGQGWCELNGTRHHVGPGCLLVIPPQTPYAFGPHPLLPWTTPWVRVTGENLELLLKELGATLEAPVIELGHDPHVVELFDNAVAVAESGNLSTTTKLFHVSQSVAYLLAFLNYRRREPAQYPPTSQERISQCIRFMKQNLKERIELNELAKLSKFSRSRFIAHFREVTGMTVMGYLTNLRMERARDLLLETDRSVKDIAMEAGYPDPYWFSNAFRCMHGMSPTEYREKNLLQ